jgi:hypothetical protein
MVGFGYKQAWFAVAGADRDAVLGVLGAHDLGEVDWQEGIDLSYLTEDRLAVTPPLSGAGDRDWVLVAGHGYMYGDPIPSVAEMSEALGTEVQFFSSYRVVEAHRWERAVDGRLVRAFAYVGERAEVTRWTGDPDAVERAIGLPESMAAGPDGEPPFVIVGEQDVMAVAAAWSVDPSSLDGLPAPGRLRMAAAWER